MFEPGTIAAQAAKSLTPQLARGAAVRRGRRRLRQGKDSSDLQAALSAVVKDGVDHAARELFNDAEEQESFRRALLDQDREAWPLVNGTYPDDLVAEICRWVAPLLAPPDEEGRVPPVRADHPYVETLATSITDQLQHWALRSGGSAVTPMWQAFVAGNDVTELLDLGAFPPRMTDLRGESLFDILQFKYRVVSYVDAGLHNVVVSETVAWYYSDQSCGGLVKLVPDGEVSALVVPLGGGLVAPSPV